MAPESREPENVNPTENAISAITKILKFNNKAITNPDEIIAVWFSWLPVGEDEDEAVYVYGYLCDLIQANHPIILGENNANLPRIVSIIASCFYREAVTVPHPEAQRMLSIVKQIEANPDLFQACINALTAEQKAALEAAYLAAASAAA